MRIRSLVSAMLGLTLAGCRGLLDATNNDTPDVAATLGTPSGVLAVAATLYQAVWVANNGTNGPASSPPIYGHLVNMSFEGYTQQNIPAQGRNALPRVAISNARGNLAAGENFRDFSGLSRNSRTACNVIVALDRLLASGQTLGSAGINLRMRSFAFFANGVSLGNLALAYDSAAIVMPSTAADETPPLRAAADVMNAALRSLDSAIALANHPDASTG